MGTTTRTKLSPAREVETPVIRWRVWPLMDNLRWSWAVGGGVLSVGGAVWYSGGDWRLSLAAMAGLSATLWQFFLPVEYEIGPLGLRQQALGRTRLMPWHAVRAYQLRSSGVVLYPRDEPTKADLLRSLFVPYPADADELLCAMREHLSHAAELPQ
jgi:hypothetical protein